MSLGSKFQNIPQFSLGIGAQVLVWFRGRRHFGPHFILILGPRRASKPLKNNKKSALALTRHPLTYLGRECESSPVVFLRLTCIWAVPGAKSLSCFPSFELSREKRAAHLSRDTWCVVQEGSMASLTEDARNVGRGRGWRGQRWKKLPLQLCARRVCEQRVRGRQSWDSLRQCFLTVQCVWITWELVEMQILIWQVWGVGRSKVLRLLPALRTEILQIPGPQVE